MMRFLLPIILLASVSANHTIAEPSRLLRFPDIHENSVSFVYAGDIYIADYKNGGQAVRLTDHDGLELFPKFSPDGEKIAFSAEFNGTRQVYIMNRDGSNLKQLTYYNDVGPMPPRGGFDYRILDWSKDGKKILVRANRLPFGQRLGRPYWVPIDGSMEQPLAVPETAGGMLSGDGNTFVYTPIGREWRTWKRYRGGRAQDVWTFNLTTNSAKQLTDHKGTDHQPVWVNGSIYFVSDRDYTLNLYRYQENQAPVKVTDHNDFDVLWPSAGPKGIVYENGGYLYRFDPVTNTREQLSITIAGNRSHQLPVVKSVASTIESFDLSDNGKRVVFAARGELFSVPAKEGIIRNISQSPSEREIAVSYSPDGTKVAYLSDRTGEYEVYVKDLKTQKAKQVTRDGTIWRFPPVWSGDGKKLAFADVDHKLWLLALDTEKLTLMDSSRKGRINHYSFSPDNLWVVYSKPADNLLPQIWLYSLESNQAQALTNSDMPAHTPAFDPQGRYLYFLSQRDYSLTFSDYEFNYLYTDATRIYAGLLNSEVEPLFASKSDETFADDKKTNEEQANNKDSDQDDTDKADTDKADSEETVEKLTIEFQGFSDRVIALSAKPSQYAQLQASKTHLFALKGQGAQSEVIMLNLEQQEPEKTVAKAGSFILSGNGEKILLVNNGQYAIVEAQADQKMADNTLDLTNMTVKIYPQLEWQQMYVDGWRILRDWFYDPNTHGMDWREIRKRYQPLVRHLAHRFDLDYIFGEIAGELNAGHIYVQTGDQPGAERLNSGLLGAQFSTDPSGYFKISKIFKGENWHQAFRSPLTEPTVKVKTGSFIIAVNGRSAKTVKNVYQLLEHLGNKTIELTVNDEPKEAGARTVQVTTLTSETNLRYLDWVNSRREKVHQLSGGRIGYIHLPNTAIEGNRELFKGFLAQTQKQALILDDRYNGGGFIPDRMIELVARSPLNYWKRRAMDPQATPGLSHNGPKAVLINHYSASGGDAFPYYFKKLGLGPLIGTRTWGGLIGISGNPGLADGGSILASTFRFLDTDGQWAVENEGVAPDIEVVDRPDLVAKGQDPTLERAVKELLKKLEQNPKKPIKAPPAPKEFN